MRLRISCGIAEPTDDKMLKLRGLLQCIRNSSKPATIAAVRSILGRVAWCAQAWRGVKSCLADCWRLLAAARRARSLKPRDSEHVPIPVRVWRSMQRQAVGWEGILTRPYDHFSPVRLNPQCPEGIATLVSDAGETGWASLVRCGPSAFVCWSSWSSLGIDATHWSSTSKELLAAVLSLAWLPLLPIRHVLWLSDSQAATAIWNRGCSSSLMANVLVRAMEEETRKRDCGAFAFWCRRTQPELSCVDALGRVNTHSQLRKVAQDYHSVVCSFFGREEWIILNNGLPSGLRKKLTSAERTEIRNQGNHGS